MIHVNRLLFTVMKYIHGTGNN